MPAKDLEIACKLTRTVCVMAAQILDHAHTTASVAVSVRLIPVTPHIPSLVGASG